MTQLSWSCCAIQWSILQTKPIHFKKKKKLQTNSKTRVWLFFIILDQFTVFFNWLEYQHPYIIYVYICDAITNIFLIIPTLNNMGKDIPITIRMRTKEWSWVSTHYNQGITQSKPYEPLAIYKHYLRTIQYFNKLHYNFNYLRWYEY